MVKFVAPVCLALGLVALSSAPAQAIPTSCFDNGTTDSIGNALLTCNLVEDGVGEEFTATDPFSPGDWFTPSYVILTDANAAVSDVVRFYVNNGVDTVTLYSSGSPNLAVQLAAALAAPASARKTVAENQTPGGATTFFVNFQANVVGARSAFVGCNQANPAANCDTINVYSLADGGVTPPPNAAVPEPATLTLMGIGSAVAAIRRRRKVNV